MADRDGRTKAEGDRDRLYVLIAGIVTSAATVGALAGSVVARLVSSAFAVVCLSVLWRYLRSRNPVHKAALAALMCACTAITVWSILALTKEAPSAPATRPVTPTGTYGPPSTSTVASTTIPSPSTTLPSFTGSIGQGYEARPGEELLKFFQNNKGLTVYLDIQFRPAEGMDGWPWTQVRRDTWGTEFLTYLPRSRLMLHVLAGSEDTAPRVLFPARSPNVRIRGYFEVVDMIVPGTLTWQADLQPLPAPR